MAASQPLPIRWLTQFSAAAVKCVRVFFALQALVGAVRIGIGLVTLNSVTALGGGLQLLLGGALVAMNGGSSESVSEVTGPGGQFVIRTARRREWRDQPGWQKGLRFVWGGHTWRTAVRLRADDPFGHTIWWSDSETQRQAIAVANRVHKELRVGEDLSRDDAA